MAKPIAYYINLLERTDRKSQIEVELLRFRNHIQGTARVEGIKTPSNGAIGCAAAHAKALLHFITETNLDSALVVEDDFFVTNSDEHVDNAFSLFNSTQIKIDCLHLAYSIRAFGEIDGNLIRVLSSTGGACYLIRRKYAYTLLASYLETHEILELYKDRIERDKANSLWALDILWSKHQAKNRVFAYHPRIGVQRESYSDIQKTIVDYKS